MAATIEVIQGDITELTVDAIVNAANAQLRGGGGVDGAIHRAAGAEALQKACRAIGGCPTGEVRVTPAFALSAKAIIHAVGPVWRDGSHDEDSLLASCYRNSLRVAQQQGLRSIAFPAISCGVYGFPIERAVGIAVDTVRAELPHCPDIQHVILCCFDEAMADRYRDELRTKPE